jgi:hypothetical protein
VEPARPAGLSELLLFGPIAQQKSPHFRGIFSHCACGNVAHRDAMVYLVATSFRRVGGIDFSLRS